MEKFQLLRDNALLALTLRIVALFVVAAEATSLALYLADVIPVDAALMIGLFSLLGPLLFAWQLRQSQEGTAELSAEGLTVQTRVVWHSYKWEHIAKIEVIIVGETSLWNRLGCRLLGIGLEQPVVRVRLRRWLRLGWVKSEAGTNVAGIPHPGFKTVQFALQDPQGFARAVQRYLALAPRER
jgi:hypothetical protein